MRDKKRLREQGWVAFRIEGCRFLCSTGAEESEWGFRLLFDEHLAGGEHLGSKPVVLQIFHCFFKVIFIEYGVVFLPQEVHTISWCRDFVTVRLAPIALCDACMSCFCDHAGTRAFRKAGFGSYGFVFAFLRRRSSTFLFFLSPHSQQHQPAWRIILLSATDIVFLQRKLSIDASFYGFTAHQYS